MQDSAELVMLLAAIKKLDKRIAWREKKLGEYRKELLGMEDQREELAERYAELKAGSEG
jgi:phage shock protein A